MKTQLYVSNDKSGTRPLRNSLNMMANLGDQSSDLTLVKADFPENLLVYVNQAAISTLKNNDEALYVVNIVLAQILQSVNSPLLNNISVRKTKLSYCVC